jgi:uncharacterized membrane protein YedE/YeeE
MGGGVLIGLSATLWMWMHGRIAGMTGILRGVLPPLSDDWQWRALFLVGSIIAPMFYVSLGHTIEFGVPISKFALIVGGIIVGVGVTYGGGCTSGHGVCGIARLSPRSILATCTFMVSTIITVYFIRHVF